MDWLWSWVNWLRVMGISIDKLNTDLLGEGKLNLLASWSIQLSDTLFNRLSSILNFWNNDAPVLSDVLAADTGQEDWLVDAGLDWLWVGNSNRNINGSDNWDVVEGLLSNFTAVVMAITSITMTMAVTMGSWLANSDHLNILLLLEGDLNSLGGGVLLLLLVAVGADLVGDLLNGLSADGPGHVIAELNINNLLDGQVDIGTRGLECWGANICNLSYILHSAVELWLLISIGWLWVISCMNHWGMDNWSMDHWGMDHWG